MQQRDSTGFTRFLAESIIDYAIIGLDLNGIILSWNRGAERILGYSASAILGSHYSRFYTPEDLSTSRPAEELRIALREGRYADVGLRLRMGNDRFWASIVTTPVLDDQGAQIGYSKVVCDLSERKREMDDLVRQASERTNDLAIVNQYLHDEMVERERVEADLRESAERFRFLANAMPQIVWTATPDGTADYYNQRFFDYTGMTLADTKGEGWKQIIHPDDLENCVTLWNLSYRSGEPYEVEYRFRRAADGAYRWHLGRAIPMRDANGDVAMWVGTCTDIDDHKNSEEALRRSHADLEQRVDARTKELLQARDEALAATRAKSDFLANMSHEIRTPINGVMGVTYLLQETELTHSQRNYVRAIRTSADILLGLINDILDLSKIEAGQMSVECVELNLRQAISDSLSMLTTHALEKRLKITREIDSEIPNRLMGDPMRVRQIMTNLLSNAIKFTDTGGVFVEARLSQAGLECVEVTISVRDTGVGVPKDRQGAIFENFTQADISTTRRYGGTGLGLSICRRLAELMGGAITLESEPGRGSTFELTLPFGVYQPPRRKRREGASGGEATHYSPVRVLLVEDNAINQLVAKGLLYSLGCTVETADTGKQAVSALQESSYDLVLMDVHMPEMDGLEATRRIRRQEDGLGRRIPIVALTAEAMSGDRERVLDAGMDGYLSKPYSKSQLASVLAEFTQHG